jgi:methylisocitrate lyase
MSERSPDDSSRRVFIHSAALAGASVLASPSLAGPGAGAQTSTPKPRPASAGARFRDLLAGPELVQCPVIYDVATARLSEIMGFPTVFAGGQPAANGMYGIGDYGNISITELIEFARRVADNVDIPIMADADDGGGNPLNVYRTVKSYDKAGVGCVMIEDMYGAKYIPGSPPGPLTSKQGFVDKIRAAVDARRGDLVILARSDALLAKESFQQGLDRLVAYAEAGADVVFLPVNAMSDSRRIVEATKKPLMWVAMPGNPDGQPAVLKANSVKIACYSIQFTMVALGAVYRGLQDIKETGTIQNYAQRALPREVMAQITRAEEASEVVRKFNAIPRERDGR